MVQFYSMLCGNLSPFINEATAGNNYPPILLKFIDVQKPEYTFCLKTDSTGRRPFRLATLVVI
jgi:hypothetical protein